jgi:hypothetical protein
MPDDQEVQDRRVAAFLKEGLSYRQVAAMLGMSLGAVQASPAADPSGNERKRYRSKPPCRCRAFVSGELSVRRSGPVFQVTDQSRAKYVPNLFEMLFAGRTSP